MSHASSLTSTQRSPSATSAKRHLPRRLLGATLWCAATLVAVASHGEPKPEAGAPPSAATVNRLRERVREIVVELAAACPVRPVDDRAAYEACQKALFGDSKFRSALKNVVLWGRAPGGNINSKLSDFRATQFGPDVFTGAYAPMWMVRGDYELEFDTNNGVMRAFVPAAFRNELPTGSYPYPFWHDAKKWTDYEDANTLVFWLDASSLKISQITFMKRDNAAKVAASTRRHMPTFDGKWMWVDAKGQTQPAPTLLLLRVFGYTARTERLFDRVAARWRLIGPVTMIAAPDVTARTIDAGDYLRWLTGRVDELFVTSRPSLDAKLAGLDLNPDPDGRFRINEFCCRDSTWQATVVELMLRADAVVMDVRGITQARRGCEFELQQLAQRLPPQRLVLVVDETTDRAVLQAAFGPRLDEVRLVEVRRSREADRAFSALVDAAN